MLLTWHYRVALQWRSQAVKFAMRLSHLRRFPFLAGQADACDCNTSQAMKLSEEGSRCHSHAPSDLSHSLEMSKTWLSLLLERRATRRLSLLAVLHAVLPLYVSCWWHVGLHASRSAVFHVLTLVSRILLFFNWRCLMLLLTFSSSRCLCSTVAILVPSFTDTYLDLNNRSICTSPRSFLNFSPHFMWYHCGVSSYCHFQYTLHPDIFYNTSPNSFLAVIFNFFPLNLIARPVYYPIPLLCSEPQFLANNSEDVSSHGDEDIDDRLVVCNAVWTWRQMPMFQSYMLPPYLELKAPATILVKFYPHYQCQVLQSQTCYFNFTMCRNTDCVWNRILSSRK